MHFLTWLFYLAVILTVAPSAARAHTAPPSTSLWNFDPAVILPLSVVAGLYCLGLLKLGRARPRSLPSSWRIITFASALLCLFLALISPLEALSSRSFAAHMLQHMLLLSVAAPLLVAARPLPVFLAALPQGVRRTLIRGFRQRCLVLWPFIARPGVAFALHALIIWAWHAPAAFQWALVNVAAHFLNHLCFLCSAYLFWWSMLHRGG